jgi:hypothetical protein
MGRKNKLGFSLMYRVLLFYALFVWLISHQPAVFFSQNKPAPAISHQPNEQAARTYNLQMKKL